MDTHLRIQTYLKRIGLVFLFLAFVSIVAYIVYQKLQPNEEPSSGTKVGIDLSPAPVYLYEEPVLYTPFNFKGTLYVSLESPEKRDSSGSALYTVRVDSPASSTPEQISINKKITGESFNLSPSVSNDGKKLVFARGEKLPSEKAEEVTTQIYVSDIAGGDVKQITNTQDLYKREPLFSPKDSLIAYIAWGKGVPKDANSELPESWATFLTDGKGNIVRVAKGCNPIFSPDGKKLLVLQNDGMHSFDISDWRTPKGEKFAFGPIDKDASYSNKIATSPDGRLIAIPSIGAGNIVVSRINWEKLTLENSLIIKTSALWVRFSPDGKYLAVNEWRKDEKENTYPVIMGYDVANGTSEVLVNLSEYNRTYLWLGSWR